MREFIFREQETTIPVKGKRLVLYAELVRCKDCTDWKRRECGTYGYCERHDGFYDQEWFCADGERKVGEGE